MIIKVDNKRVDLPDDIQIRFDFYFPSPLSNAIPASATQWFTFAQTYNNQQVFRNAEHLQIANKVSAFDCVVEVAGVQLTGKLFLQSTTGTDYKCFIAFNKTLTDLQDKKLSEVVDFEYYLGSTTANIIAEAKAISQQPWPIAKIAFPMIYTPEFYSSNEDFAGVINDYDYNNEAYVENTDSNINALVPGIYLFEIFKQIFASNALTSKLTTNSTFNKLLLMTNSDLAYFDKTETATTEQTTELVLDAPTAGYGDIIYPADAIIEDANSNFNLATKEYTLTKSGYFKVTVIFYAKMVNDLFASSKAYLVQNGTTTVYDTGFIQVKDRSSDYVAVKHTLIFNATTTGDTYQVKGNFFGAGQDTELPYFYMSNAIVTFNPITYSSRNQFARTFNFSDVLPDISANDFLSEAAKKIGIGFFFSLKNNRIEYVLLKDIVSNLQALELSDNYIDKEHESLIITDDYLPVETITDDFIVMNNAITPDYTVNNFASLPSAKKQGDIAFVKELNQYFTAAYSNGNIEWLVTADAIEASYLDETTASEAVDVKMSSMPMSYDAVRETSIPKTKLAGYSPAFNQQQKSGELKLLFYNGFKEIATGKYIPQASPVRWDNDGNEIADFDLVQNGEKGLWNVLLKDYYNYINSRDKVTMRFNIDEGIFMQIIDLFEPNKSIRKVRVRGVNYIPERVSIIAGMNGIEDCEMELR